MAITVTTLLAIFCAFANCAIGIYVLRRDPRSATHRAFFLLVMPVAVWAFALALAHSATTPTLWYVKLTFATGSLVPIAMLRFAERLRHPDRRSSVVTRWIFIPVSLAFSLTSWSSWIVQGFEVYDGGVQVLYGPLHALFAVYAVGCFAVAIYVLFSTYRETAGSLRLQSAYVLVAMSVPTALAIVTNLLIPLTLRTSTASRYGPIFSLIMLGLIGHAIIRHRFMDIRVVVKQGVVYLAAFSVAARGAGPAWAAREGG